MKRTVYVIAITIKLEDCCRAVAAANVQGFRIQHFSVDSLGRDVGRHALHLWVPDVFWHATFRMRYRQRRISPAFNMAWQHIIPCDTLAVKGKPLHLLI